MGTAAEVVVEGVGGEGVDTDLVDGAGVGDCDEAGVACAAECEADFGGAFGEGFHVAFGINGGDGGVRRGPDGAGEDDVVGLDAECQLKLVADFERGFVLGELNFFDDSVFLDFFKVAPGGCGGVKVACAGGD